MYNNEVIKVAGESGGWPQKECDHSEVTALQMQAPWGVSTWEGTIVKWPHPQWGTQWKGPVSRPQWWTQEVTTMMKRRGEHVRWSYEVTTTMKWCQWRGDPVGDHVDGCNHIVWSSITHRSTGTLMLPFWYHIVPPHNDHSAEVTKVMRWSQ